MGSPQSNKALESPDKGAIKFPSGYILVNVKWKEDHLVKELAKRIRVAYSDSLGFIDFYLTENTSAVYIGESDLENFKECKQKLSKFKLINKGKGYVIAIWNSKTLREFSDIQEYAVLDLGLFVIPVSCVSEVPAVLYKLAMHEIKSPRNSRKGIHSSVHSSVQEQVSLLTKIPGVGEEEAKLLLQRFGNIVCVCEASKDSLKSTVGERIATQVFRFFNHPVT